MRKERERGKAVGFDRTAQLDGLCWVFALSLLGEGAGSSGLSPLGFPRLHVIIYELYQSLSTKPHRLAEMH